WFTRIHSSPEVRSAVIIIDQSFFSHSSGMASDQKEKISQRAFEIEIRTGGRMNYRNANALIPQERSQQCDTSISETPIFDRM
ncbi:hypothetical protein PENTCL1PPCAC_29651, partial [Pristionchus entomophagus]